jgi:transcriptional regulator GlxA family with amidase domain
MRRVVILAFKGVQSLDVSGPAEAFSIATRYFGGDYAIELVTPDGAPARSHSGLALNADAPMAAATGAIDTLVVAGGAGAFAAAKDERVTAWVADAAARSRRVASVCTGAFVLAAAGLLDGRRVTTHWSACNALARTFPAVTVERDPIYVRDGDVLTSAGITSGMDLALAMVEDDLGRDVALQTARWLVLFVQRPGGQAQFSASLAAQQAERAPLRELQAWILDHLDADLSVPALAARAHMSQRHFARAFAREVGITPAAYVETVRVERARQRLDRGAASLEAVARDCGFPSAETMRRAFHRRLGVPPSHYRERFAA